MSGSTTGSKLKLTQTVALDILRVLLSAEVMKAERIAVKIDGVPQSVRNNLVWLKQEGLVKRVSYAHYQITDLGKWTLEQVVGPLQDSTKKEDK